MSFQVTGLDHIVLLCRDVEASIAFYCGELGLSPVRVDEWRRGEVLFPSARITPTCIIDLFQAEPTGANLEHLCLTYEGADLDDLAEQFPNHRIGHALFGAQGLADSIYIQDPDGNTVELRRYEQPAG